MFRRKSQVAVLTTDELAGLVDDRFQEFVSAMAAAGDPGAEEYPTAWTTLRGWMLPPARGDHDERVVLGTDGLVHVLGDSRTRNTKHLTASEWLFAGANGMSPRERGRRFSQQLSAILAEHHVPDE
jgi:hypothetical protein